MKSVVSVWGRRAVADPVNVLRFVSLVGLLGCGGGANALTPAAAPTDTAASKPAKVAEPAPVVKEGGTTPAATPAEEEKAEPCDGGWVCVKVDVAARTSEQRTTKLIGDPKIDQTYSKTTDGRRPIAFGFFSKGNVELLLRRKPGNKAEVTLKPASGPEIVLDRHDVNDFTYIGAVAAEQGGSLLIDIRYMR